MSRDSVINDYIAGAVGGAAGLIVGHPFDTIKVHLQTRQTYSALEGSWHATKTVSQSGLSKGFFRGLSFPLASYAVVNSVFFGVYGNTLRLIQGSDTTTKPNYRQIFVAGSCAGFFQLFVACPVDVVKVVLQSQVQTTAEPISVYFRGPIDCVSCLWKRHGIRSVYRGLPAMFYRDVPTYGVYMTVYEMSRDYLSGVGPLVGEMVSGGVAGVIAWTLALPMDVVKSLQQADVDRLRHNSCWHCIQNVYRLRGVRGFFVGWTMCSLRAFPTNAVTFLCYEQTLKMLASDN